MLDPATVHDANRRQLVPQWDGALIAASIAISFLGSFTSTQLMCHARMSLHFSSVFLWTGLTSIIFGFCSIWCLHEVAMLGCRFDILIGVNTPLTILSAVLAVLFTWIALASDLLWDRYQRSRKRRKRNMKRSRKQQKKKSNGFREAVSHMPGSTPLLQSPDEDDEEGGGDDHHDGESGDDEGYFDGETPRQSQHLNGSHSQSIISPFSDSISMASAVSPGTVLLKPPSSGFRYDDAAPEQGIFSDSNGMSSASKAWLASGQLSDVEASRQSAPAVPTTAASEADGTETGTRTSSDWSSTRRDSSAGGSSSGYLGLSSAMGIVYRRGTTTGNAFVAIARALYNGCTIVNVLKGLFWSVAVTSMHYVGITGLIIPHGSFTLDLTLVVISGLISWTVCLVGIILMANIETQITQQLLFSAVATMGVAGMHFTGMRAATFWSSEQPSEERGYPPALANSVIAVAGITCIAANLLLAQSATASRNKLAEIVWTRKELWKAIAQKENAEAAAMARSEFIASASHEIRTPLHHLQGYSDLLSHTDLTEEGRALLMSIQRATKTLSMITTNVLDWSKLERNAEAAYRPIALDIRSVCESVINLLPNIDDESNVELFLVVSPDVPSSLFLDETYVHRILMNLLSNALKFTRSGYVMLSIETSNGKLLAKVEDTGCGLDPDFIPRMWDPYQQGEVRGTQRGTGLGLSIIRQLLNRMQGTIDVESRFLTEDPEPEFRSGSTFTITLPLQTTSTSPDRRRSSACVTRPHVALLVKDENSVYADGLQSSWEKFGYHTTVAMDFADLPQLDWKYIWASANYLKKNPAQFQELMQRNDTIVLVPSNSQDTLSTLPGIQAASQFVILQKPLTWHLFEKRVQSSQQRPLNAAPTKTLRFAPEVEVMETSPKEKDRPRLARKSSHKAVVLIVEDNPINQRLGKKMLTALGYDVLTADDGQAGIEMIIAHDTTIDVILMDESMPRKCGTQATKEIREMEAEGKLSRRRPIIAVTAVVNPHAQAQFHAAGADSFLAKPLSLAKLRDTLASHLAHT